MTSLVNGAVIQRLTTAIPPTLAAGSDIMMWKGSANGQFSVKSAYELIDKCPEGVHTEVWKAISRWRGAKRIRVFLWLVFNNRLPTNYWRSKWTASTPQCSFCNSGVEDVLHVVRDCGYAGNMWVDLIHPRYMSSFFIAGLRDWIALNLKKELGKTSTSDWNLIWGVAVWLLWKWRSNSIFRTDFIKPYNPLAVVNSVWRTFAQSEDLREVVNSSTTVTRVTWEPPQLGWVKVNVDGAVTRNRTRAGCGGVITDHKGNWIVGFTQMLTQCTVLEAKEWGVYKGLLLAWEHGFKRVIVESDSRCLVEALLSDEAANTCSLVSWQIRQLLLRNWVVQLEYIPREKNELADGMAKEGLSRSAVVRSPPMHLRSLCFKRFWEDNSVIV